MVDEHLFAEGGGDRFAGEVVVGRAEAAGHDDEVGAVEGALEGVDDAVEVVAHDGLEVEVDAEGGQARGEPGGVGVDDLAEQDFGAYGDDLGLHVGKGRGSEVAGQAGTRVEGVRWSAANGRAYSTGAKLLASVAAFILAFTALSWPQGSGAGGLDIIVLHHT